MTVESFEPKIGATLNGRYELEACIGKGGMGEVWRARDLSLRRQVAIKFLTGALADREETRNRFLVEAQVTAQINSRHAVLVYDFGVTGGGRPYFVLELLHGETLAQRLERLGKLDAETTITILKKAARALGRAHALRIVHRDFKPDNVFLTVSTEEGEEEGAREDIKVVDFGIAKLIGNLEEARVSLLPESAPTLSSEAIRSLTRTNSFVGTPQYMPPEQIQQLEVGPPADIWALGVVAFECLTGTSPFAGTSVLELFANIQLGRAHSAHGLEPSIPPAFDTWFARATARVPEERFPDANQAVAELAAALLPGRAPMPSVAESPPRLQEGLALGGVTSTGAGVESLHASSEVAGLPRKRSPALVAVAAVVVVGLSWAGVTRLRTPSGAAAAVASSPSSEPRASSPSAERGPLPVAAASAPEAPPSASASPSASAPHAVAAPALPKETAPAPKSRARGAKEPSPAPKASEAPAAKASEPPAKHPPTAPSSPFTLPPLGL